MEATAHISDEHFEERPKDIAAFGMKIFLISEAMLFAGLIVGYIVLRAGVPEWPPTGAYSYHMKWPLGGLQLLMVCNTILLISSSFTYHAAEVVIRRGGAGTLWLIFSALLGAIFLSVQGYEWHHLKEEGLWLNTFGVYGSSFFVLTGFHGLHVFIGLVMILIATFRSIFIRVKSHGHASGSHVYEECVGLYWHFVDVVWVFLFTVLYVL